MNIQQTASTPKLVTMIPADPQMTERDIRNKHLRIAPYCRVSTDKKEQLSSYMRPKSNTTRKKSTPIQIGRWSDFMRMRASLVPRPKAKSFFSR